MLLLITMLKTVTVLFILIQLSPNPNHLLLLLKYCTLRESIYMRSNTMVYTSKYAESTTLAEHSLITLIEKHITTSTIVA